MKYFSTFLILFLSIIVGQTYSTNDTTAPSAKSTAPTVNPTLGDLKPAVVATPTISPDETE
jgi:hypothetical protein